MKERPILFSAPMVRALLAGRKTQTRRAISSYWQRFFRAAAYAGEISDFLDSGTLEENDPSYINDHCQYGQPGDRLWVKETWADAAKNVDPEIAIAAGYKTVAEAKQAHARWAFRADYDNYMGPLKWTPSIFMPRWASRITLEIVAVRVVRLNDISRGDCLAEGCPFPNMANGDDPRKWYRDLWDSINGGGSWTLNPWVWVIEFRRLE